MEDSRTPVGNLAESIHSLLGFKSHLTSDWVSSVCSIIRNLPSEAAPAAELVAHKDSEELSSLENAVDSNNEVIGIKEEFSRVETDELAQLLSVQNQLDAQRRQLLSEFLDLKGNIRVFCRIRPTLMWHDFNQPSPVMALNSNDLILQLSASKRKQYSFDKVFKPNSSQDEVFSDIEPIIKSVVDGYNACIFAYGQTGSGKTHTMEGTPECPGVVQRGIEALFKQATVSSQEFTVTFSMLEIYLGHLKDLLARHSRVTDFVQPCLSVQTDPRGGIEITNLTSVQVSSSEQALKLYALGCQLRSTATTNLNKTSSRSHCMIRIKIQSLNGRERIRERSKLWMIDLGGSERVQKTKAHGRRFEEGKAINLSLSAIGDVVDALQRKKCHIPYRNSKLTLILQDCLGDDSKTLMLVHVSPEKQDLSESVCSLNFATRARSIHLDSRESKDAKDRKNGALLSLQQQIDKIEAERQGIKKKIEKINKTFESLAKASNLPSSQCTGDPQIIRGASIDAVCNDKIKSMQKLPSLELPRFMQPTVCSARKYDAEQKFYDDRSVAPARRRRRSISQRANSVSFPLKRNAVYSSDLSTSSVVDLKVISTVDNVTECSQTTSECDTQTTDFQTQGGLSKATAHQRVHQNHVPIVPDNIRRRKWESRWPIQDKNVGEGEQKQKRGLALSGRSRNALSFELLVNQKEPDNVDDCRLNIMSRSEIAKSFTITRSDALCHPTSREPWTQHPYLEKCLPKVAIDASSLSSDQVWNESTPANDLLDQKDSMPLIYNDIKGSKSLAMDQPIHDTPNEEYADFGEPFGESLSQGIWVQFTQTCCHATAKKSITECIPASHQSLSNEKTQYVHGSQSRRALFTGILKEDKVNDNTPIVHSQVIRQGKGLIISIKMKIQMLYVCALIWMGFWNLGYTDDFFHSLTC